MIQHELQQIIHTGDRLTNSAVRKVLKSLYDKNHFSNSVYI